MPESCCAGDKAICQGHEKLYGPPEKGPPMMKGYLNNEHLYTEGCYDKLVAHLKGHSLILGGIGACVPLLLVSKNLFTQLKFDWPRAISKRDWSHLMTKPTIWHVSPAKT